MDNANSDKQAEITINRNGPIKVVGNFVVTGVNNQAIDFQNSQEVYLCACGHSKNKPLCDGSHKRVTTQ